MPSSAAELRLWTGSGWESGRSGNVGQLGSTTVQDGLLAVTPPGEWAVTSVGTTGAVATATRAGATGVSHVARCLTLCLSGTSLNAASGIFTANLIDGTSGSTTYLWRAAMSLGAVAGAFESMFLSGLNLIGTTGRAMTLEFAAAGTANTVESVSLGGFSVD